MEKEHEHVMGHTSLADRELRAEKMEVFCGGGWGRLKLPLIVAMT